MVVTSKLVTCKFGSFLQICNRMEIQIFIKVLKRFTVTLLVVYLSCFANRGKVTKRHIAKRKSPALCKQTKQSKAKAGKRAKVNNILAGGEGGGVV